MIPYIENHRDATRKILGSINIFCTVSKYKNNTKKSLCSYTKNTRSKKKYSNLLKRKEKKTLPRNKPTYGVNRHELIKL